MLDEAWADAMAANAARFPGRNAGKTVTLSTYGLMDETLKEAVEEAAMESLFTAKPLLWALRKSR
jgi:hypothetical protein